MTDQYIITDDQLEKIMVGRDITTLREVRSNPYDPQASYQSGFDEGFSIGKSQCETHHDNIKQADREKVLSILNTLYTDSLFLSDGSFECNAICDKIHGVLAELRQDGKVDGEL